MSVATVSFTRPTLTVTTNLNTPFTTDADEDGITFLRFLTLGALSTTILLDNLIEEYGKGRSFTDDQSSIYRSLEDKINNTYGLNGRGCLLRFICDLQRFPIKHLTIVGEILTSVFTPREDGRELLSEYREAQWIGMENQEDTEASEDSCRKHYAASCPFSVMNYFNPSIQEPQETLNEV